jgi:hypothetical protein
MAQDTVVFKDGQKRIVKIISVDKRINYTDSTGKDYFSLGQVEYIHYATGEKLTISIPTDNKGSIHSEAYYGHGEYTDTFPKKNFDSPKKHDYRPIAISAGYGVSAIQMPINAQVQGGSFGFLGPGPNFLSISPVYSGIIDYTFFNYMSIGICGAYQWVTDNPVYITLYGFPSGYAKQTIIVPWETEKITRENIAIRFTVKLPLLNILNYYAGVRVGESVWTDKITSDSNKTGGYIYTTMPSPIIHNLSFQILNGLELFPIYNIGIHIELGVGTPYFLEGGITFRFKTKKQE